MDRPFTAVIEAIHEARTIQEAADNNAEGMADILDGRLRQVKNRWLLSRLKRQLRDFDMVKGKWKP